MPRTFTAAQRRLLFKLTGGLCARCKKPLTVGWHADHIVPHSRGGKTEVSNGQALCASCNVRKAI